VSDEERSSMKNAKRSDEERMYSVLFCRSITPNGRAKKGRLVMLITDGPSITPAIIWPAIIGMPNKRFKKRPQKVVHNNITATNAAKLAITSGSGPVSARVPVVMVCVSTISPFLLSMFVNLFYHAASHAAILCSVLLTDAK